MTWLVDSPSDFRQVRSAEEIVGQESIVAEKRAACRLGSGPRGTGVGFEIETWTIKDMKRVVFEG
jgi:hypothetical protein